MESNQIMFHRMWVAIIFCKLSLSNRKTNKTKQQKKQKNRQNLWSFIPAVENGGRSIMIGDCVHNLWLVIINHTCEVHKYENYTSGGVVITIKICFHVIQILLGSGSSWKTAQRCSCMKEPLDGAETSRTAVSAVTVSCLFICLTVISTFLLFSSAQAEFKQHR